MPDDDLPPFMRYLPDDLRRRVADAITDALVEFDRHQHEGYGKPGEFSDRLARISRVNDAQRALWAVEQVLGPELVDLRAALGRQENAG